MKGRKPKSELSPTHHYTKKELEAQKRTRESHKSVPDGLSCPKVLLDPIAKDEWKRLMPLYRKLGIDVLNDLDVPTLIAYCMAWAVYRRAMEEYSDDPRSSIEIYNDDGDIVKVQQNPILKTMREQGLLIAKYAEQLGLSPLGRIRLGRTTEKKKEKKPVGFDALYDDDDEEIPPIKPVA